MLKILCLAMLLTISTAVKPIEVSPAPGVRLELRLPSLRSISEASKDEVRQFVTDHPDVIGMQILAADFIMNERINTFVYHHDQVLMADWNEYAGRTGGRAPLFSSDVNEESRIRTNTRYTRIINGEFVCLEWKDTLGFRVLGENFKAKVVQFCQKAIPVTGPFSGYSAVYLSRAYTGAELEKFEAEVEALNTRIWERDIKARK